MYYHKNIYNQERVNLNTNNSSNNNSNNSRFIAINKSKY